jgi:ADP-heptose:LPS heptosyltransferase
VDEKLAGCFVVAINAGGGWYTKRWGIPRFAALADRIAESYNAKIILCWGPGEKEGAEQLKSSMRHQASLIPPSTLKQLAAILQRVNVMVTNDSGPMHMAAVVGTPVLAVFGPTNPRFQGPVGDSSVVVRNETLDCLGCNLTACPIGLPCMEKLEVDDVMRGFDRLMKGAVRK